MPGLGLGLGLDFLDAGTKTLEIPFLDEFSGAAAAYSLRTLSSSGGNVVRVRRSSDNAEDDFTATEVVDGTMLSWVGTTASDDGFVTTWYDQAGSNDATQATAASQPKIVDAGVLVEENGRPAVDFDGVDDYLQASTYFANFLHESESSVFSVASVNSGTNNGSAIISTSNAGNYESAFIGYYLSVDNRSGYTNRGGVVVTNGLGGYPIVNVVDFRYIDDQQYLISAISNPSDATVLNRSLVYNNGSDLLQNNSQTSAPASGNSDAQLKIFRTFSSLKGLSQEIIIYPSDQSSNRIGIETNINNHYNIYP